MKMKVSLMFSIFLATANAVAVVQPNLRNLTCLMTEKEGRGVGKSQYIVLSMLDNNVINVKAIDGNDTYYISEDFSPDALTVDQDMYLYQNGSAQLSLSEDLKTLTMVGKNPRGQAYRIKSEICKQRTHRPWHDSDR